MCVWRRGGGGVGNVGKVCVHFERERERERERVERVGRLRGGNVKDIEHCFIVECDDIYA